MVTLAKNLQFCEGGQQFVISHTKFDNCVVVFLRWAGNNKGVIEFLKMIRPKDGKKNTIS